MIRLQTCLKISDNTGAKKVMCIRILGNNRKYGKVGDTFIGVIKEALPNIIMKRKTIVRAVIIRTRKMLKRPDGIHAKFDDNAAVLLNPDNSPKGTRIFGPIAKELRDRKFIKVIALASEMI